MRTVVYRQKVGELEFTDRKQEDQSLQIESDRTGVYGQKVGADWSLQIESDRTVVYRQKVGQNYILQIESRRTGSL